MDVGANRGGYVECVIQKFPNCEVVAFEPSKTNLQTLRQKFADTPRVVIEPKELSDKSVKQILYANSEGSSLASLTKRRLDHFNIDFSFEEEIATIRFEDYWRKNLASQKIDIVKINIEGHELEAFSGMGDTLGFTDVIQFEFGGCNIDTRTFFRIFGTFSHLEDSGFIEKHLLGPRQLTAIRKWTRHSKPLTFLLGIQT